MHRVPRKAGTIPLAGSGAICYDKGKSESNRNRGDEQVTTRQLSHAINPIRTHADYLYYTKQSQHGYQSRPAHKVRPYWMDSSDPEAYFCGYYDI